MAAWKTLVRAAGLGLCTVAFTGTALADPGNGNGNGPAVTPPGQEQKAETPAAAPPPAAAPAPQQAAQQKAAPQNKGQEKKAEKQAEKAARKAAPKPAPALKAQAAKPAKAEKAKPAKVHTAKPTKVEKTAPVVAAKAKPEKTSGSYKNTSSGTDLKNGMSHKHTICHATGSASNPYVRITPSVSGVFNGHIGHQGDEDIIPPFTYKGQTYSQNWDAAGQALFNAGCAAPAAAAPLTPVVPTTTTTTTGACPTSTTTTEKVLVGVWHATGAIKDGKRKFVFISPSEGSAHYGKHEDDVPVYEDRAVTTTASAESCATVTPTSNPAPPAAAVQPPAQQVPQPVVPVPAGQTPAPGAVGVVAVGGVAGAVSPANAAATPAKAAPAEAEKDEGGVLGAVASAPEAIAETATSGTLPFTGIPLWIAALLGAALLLAGVAMRRSA